jgi:DNA polymerase III epsilon subunit-like protein
MILFFDTETTGLPKRRNAPLHDTDNWPRMVQLAWIQYDEKQKVKNKSSLIIKPVGFRIPKDASDIHGISHERALREGVPLKDALYEFEKAIRNSELLVAHNFQFDYPVIYTEFLRSGISHQLANKKNFCTMMSTKNLLRIPHPKIRNDYKWPKLEELHRWLFREGFDNAHDAATDVEITAKCFWELHKRKLIQIHGVISEKPNYIHDLKTGKNTNHKIKAKSFFELLKKYFNF